MDTARNDHSKERRMLTQKSRAYAGRRPSPCRGALGDLRFRALLSQRGLGQPSPAVRRRFSKRLAGGRTAIYVGKVARDPREPLRRLLAMLARLIGGPLPTSCDTECRASSRSPRTGQPAARSGRGSTRAGRGFPQVIHSAKRFAGPTGLEEISAAASAWR